MRAVLSGLLFVIVFCGVVSIWVHHPGNASMAFMERTFGFSPDGGDGSFEILLLVLGALTVGAIGLSLRSPVR